MPWKDPTSAPDGVGLRQSLWPMRSTGLISLGAASLFPAPPLGAVSLQVGKSKY